MPVSSIMFFTACDSNATDSSTSNISSSELFNFTRLSAMATDDLQQVSGDDSQLIISPKIGQKNRSENRKNWSNESSIYLQSTLSSKCVRAQDCGDMEDGRQREGVTIEEPAQRTRSNERLLQRSDITFREDDKFRCGTSSHTDDDDDSSTV